MNIFICQYCEEKDILWSVHLRNLDISNKTKLKSIRLSLNFDIGICLECLTDIVDEYTVLRGFDITFFSNVMGINLNDENDARACGWIKRPIKKSLQT